MTELENYEETEEINKRYKLAADKLKDLTEDEKKFLSSISNLMGKLFIDRKFIELVRYVVKRKLGGILVTSDSDDIANDAISHVVESTRISIILKTSKSFSKEKLGDRIPSIPEIQRYLIAGIKNYCNTRLQRWSTDQKIVRKTKSKEGEEITHSKENESNAEHNPKRKVAIRAREYISSDCASDSDFWDQHISSSLNEEDLDLVKALEILNSKGLSAEQFDLILDCMSGITFSTMAKEKGGSQDQYRKAFNRAIEKIGIDKKMILSK